LTWRDAASVRIKVKAPATHRHHRERAVRARWLATSKVRFLYGRPTYKRSTRYSGQVLMKLEISRQLSQNNLTLIFMKVPPLRPSCSIRTNGQVDRQDGAGSCPKVKFSFRLFNFIDFSNGSLLLGILCEVKIILCGYTFRTFVA
jgi:hypothetical protein